VSTALLLGTSSVASAGPVSTASSCPGWLCLYEGANFTGEMFTATSLSQGGSCVSLVAAGWGDRAHSAINLHRTTVSMFANDNCVGGPFGIPGGSSLSSFGSFTPESVWVPHWTK
jgi:hypothetical protein